MKAFERLVLTHLKDITGPLLDSLQFAYRGKRILFVDFSLAFNTIILEILHSKLYQLTVSASTCQWITNFLTDRRQQDLKWDSTIDTINKKVQQRESNLLQELLIQFYTAIIQSVLCSSITV
ncbi:hypothetical protein D4764_01G0015440 [Takifugu flavidus]|uniref:Reverse transcriptase domain-containing protein n=1 Tax=Takifugu flavidus TaxID=433684 RepID=A0A5C6PS32_9TELE|nr:hypothetical protein D4764_01G0015440 [Takifugu flavidus]